MGYAANVQLSNSLEGGYHADPFRLRCALLYLDLISSVLRGRCGDRRDGALECGSVDEAPGVGRPLPPGERFKSVERKGGMNHKTTWLGMTLPALYSLEGPS